MTFPAKGGRLDLKPDLTSLLFEEASGPIKQLLVTAKTTVSLVAPFWMPCCADPCDSEAPQLGRTVRFFPSLGSLQHFLSLRRLVLTEGLSVAFSLLPLNPVSKVCGFFSNRVFWEVPRATATVDIALGVSWTSWANTRKEDSHVRYWSFIRESVALEGSPVPQVT